MQFPSKWLSNDSVHFDDKSPCVIMRTDSSASRVMVLADKIIPSNEAIAAISSSNNEVNCVVDKSSKIYYFEIEILSNVNEGGTSEVAVGVACIDSIACIQERLAGVSKSFMTLEGSVFYSNTGLITRREYSQKAQIFGTHDIIGCGCRFNDGWNFFFTCNGVIIPDQVELRLESSATQSGKYIPAVELLGIGTSVRANFGSEKFVFPLDDALLPQRAHQVQCLPAGETKLGMSSFKHSQAHSFISRISSQITQPLLRHSQFAPTARGLCEFNNETAVLGKDIQDKNTEDYMVELASALSLDDAATVGYAMTAWTEADTSQAQEALSLLNELIPSQSSTECPEGVEAIASLRNTLRELQVRMRCSIDISPENAILLELNDEITEILQKTTSPLRPSLHKASFIPDDGSSQLSLVSIMYMLRRGTKDEVMLSVRQILQLCNFNNESVSAIRPITDIRVAGGLQTLISTLHRCTAWPDVELQISLAIAILVAYETDWQILMKEATSILSSLQILLLRQADVTFMHFEGDEQICERDRMGKILRLVSAAVHNFCSLLCDECMKPFVKSTAVCLNGDDTVLESHLDIRRNLSTASNHRVISSASDDATLGRTLETLVNIIKTICSDIFLETGSGKNGECCKKASECFDKTVMPTHDSSNAADLDTVKRCDNVESKRQYGDSLTRSQSNPELLRAHFKHDQSPCSTLDANVLKEHRSLNMLPYPLPLIVLHEDIIVLCSQSLSSLCKVEDFHASLVASDMLTLLVSWLKDGTSLLNLPNHLPFGYELLKNVSMALASITAAGSSSTRPISTSNHFNVKDPTGQHSNYTIGWIDAQIMAVELPVALVSFIEILLANSSIACPSEKKSFLGNLENLGVANMLTSLKSLASRSQNRTFLASCAMPATVMRLLMGTVAELIGMEQLSPVVKSYNDCEVSELNSKTNVIGMRHQISYCRNLCGLCLEILSFFLVDCIADLPLSSPSTGAQESPPTTVTLMMQPPAIKTLLYLFKLSSSIPRLQAVRVVSMIVDWQQAMEILYQEGISSALAVLLEDANERFEYDILDRVDRDAAHVVDTSSVAPSTQHVLEEAMRACYSLANICHAKLSYALQLFENGLMTIVLRTACNEHIEVRRQAIRCISGMCPVLSILTPGAHPSRMIASLKSETTMPNATRSQSGSVTETRAMAKKLHGNVIDFVNALRALTHALSSPNVLIKQEALVGISHLAKDDHLRVGIIEGPLQLIISLLLDPQSESELKQLAESVLINIGFIGGREDLDVVGNDHHLLSEWFYMRRSLRLQKRCYDLLNQWINGLFLGCDVAEKKAKQLYITELGREAALAENVDDDDSFCLHFAEGIDIDIRDTLDLVGLSVITHVIEKVVTTKSQNVNLQNTSLPVSAHRQSADLREALLLQFTHLFDAWKLLRYPQASAACLASEEWIKDKGEQYFNFSPGGGNAKRRAGHLTERFLTFINFCSGRGAQRVVDEEEIERVELIAEEKQHQVNMIQRDDASFNLSNYDYSLEDLDDRLNFPPCKVSECLDLFFPSKLQQYVVCDLFCIGKSNSVSCHSTNAPQTPQRSQHGTIHNSKHIPFKIPEPKQFRSLVLPSRPYFSFAREGRVLRKILDDVANVEMHDMSVEASVLGGYADVNKTLWSLAFRDSFFHGEFIMTLVNTLRSLPQISSLSFVSKSPQDDSELGYLGGNVPSTVRFLSFQNALSSASIDAFCTYLKAQNVSFQRTHSKANTASPGLTGLAISHTSLTSHDVLNICTLLKENSRDDSQGSNTPTEEDSSKIEAPGMTLQGGLCGSSHCRLNGLRYLDLSHNKLSDEQCSNILSASMHTSLEGLELKGNYIHRGLYFCPTLEKYLNGTHCSLRHIGVSSNGFINSTFRSILECCQNSKSLTSIDLSSNELTSSEKNCNRVRKFLKSNNTLMSLNLSSNRFTSDMTRVFHLGLLENDSLILLRLDGNISMNEREMYLVRGKLKANRDRYVDGYYPSTLNASSSSKRRDDHSQRRSESCTNGSSLVTDQAKEFSDVKAWQNVNQNKDSNLTCLGRSQSDFRTEPEDLSRINPVVATRVENDASFVDVPMSTAFFPNRGDYGDHAFNDAKGESALTVKTKDTICVLFSAPLAWTDTRNRLHPIQTLDYPGERDTLIQAFREASRDIGVRFDFATTDSLRTALSLGVKVLHFSGHGHPHCLNFEDGRGGLQFVTMDALRALCQAGGNQLDFVFVSACHSRQAGEAFLGAGVPHVVCVTVEAQLLDAAAMAFTRAFYLALAVGHTVSHSFEIGKQAVITSPYVPNSLVEGEKFLLLPEQSDHAVPLFEAPVVNQWPILGSSLRGLVCDLINNSYLPRTPEDFEGREVDMYCTIRILINHRLVTIVGENGCGKSSLAIAVSSYLCERRKFDDGVIFVRLRGVVSHESFLQALSNAMKSGPQLISHRFIELNKAPVSSSIRDQEEVLLSFLSPLKSLIVLANVSGLLAASNAVSTDFKMFLRRLFDRCASLKVLTTGNEVIGMTGFGIVEHVVSLGPLSLYSSLRLFARLSPPLATAVQKVKFVKTLLIPEQAHVTLESRELSPAAARILYMLGGGHPSRIVKLACESSREDIRRMLSKSSPTKHEKDIPETDQN